MDGDLIKMRNRLDTKSLMTSSFPYEKQNLTTIIHSLKFSRLDVAAQPSIRSKDGKSCFAVLTISVTKKYVRPNR